MLQGDRATKERAKVLRRQMSLPKVLLWQRLRLRPGGLKFRRQHDALKFVLDFYCHETRTIIEIDGISHDLGNRPQRDEKRDAVFHDKEFKAIRIAAREVLADPDQVSESIILQCRTREA